MTIHDLFRRNDGFGVISITEATKDDIDDLMTIDFQSFHDTWDRAGWLDTIESQSMSVLVAARSYQGKRSGPIEGYIVYGEGAFSQDGVVESLRGGDRISCVLSIAVLRDSRQMGIGGKLLRSVSDIGRSDVHAFIASGANEAMELFGSHGYVVKEYGGGEAYVHVVNRKKETCDAARETRPRGVSG